MPESQKQKLRPANLDNADLDQLLSDCELLLRAYKDSVRRRVMSDGITALCVHEIRTAKEPVARSLEPLSNNRSSEAGAGRSEAGVGRMEIPGVVTTLQEIVRAPLHVAPEKIIARLEICAELLRETTAENQYSRPQRKRSTKKATEQKTAAAIWHKINNPHATEADCAAAAQISQSTLNQQSDWIDMVPKVEHAHDNGTINRFRRVFDSATGDVVTLEELRSVNP